MKHARQDYQHIQDPSGRIPIDEPVILLRGQDKLAPLVLSYWCEEAVKLGVDKAMINEMLEHIEEMHTWQKKNKVKMPDMPETFEPVMLEGGEKFPYSRTGTEEIMQGIIETVFALRSVEGVTWKDIRPAKEVGGIQFKDEKAGTVSDLLSWTKLYDLKTSELIEEVISVLEERQNWLPVEHGFSV